MPGHDAYGKRVLAAATGGRAAQFGPAVEVHYGVGLPARIDGCVGGMIAVELESRVSKQVRGAVLDLICHDCPKKLLALLPVHMNPVVTADQCRKILARFCQADCFRVVILTGSGENPRVEEDAAILGAALKELGAAL